MLIKKLRVNLPRGSMKFKKNSIYSAIILSFLLVSCESKTGTGALVGGGLGAGAGALIGGGKGALIGGAVGIVGGAIVGHLLEEDERDRVQQNSPKTLNKLDNGEQLSVDDVISLHKSGISDKKIKELISKTQSRYNLNTHAIKKLERAGVSSDVIDFMMKSK